jgi:3-oxoacyl-(acyl-carrier-protein) synthase
MMDNDFMAESANIKELVDEAEGLNILLSRKEGPFKRAMSNSFGFGGTNCALVFDKYEE